MKGVYIIHLDPKMAHAQHYCGFADDVERRVEAHRGGQGARRLAVAMERRHRWGRLGVGRRRSAAWDERLLKRQKNMRRYCPICNPGAKLPASLCCTRTGASQAQAQARAQARAQAQAQAQAQASEGGEEMPF